MPKLLAIDISTNSTGYSVFDLDSKKLLEFGMIKPSIPGLHKMRYPESSLNKMKNIAEQLKDLLLKISPTEIVIEEVNRGPRISQKTLDATHFFVLDYLTLADSTAMKKIHFMDSNGKEGWRTFLGMRLSDEDKAKNKKIRTENKRSKFKYAPIDWKTLACRYVEANYSIKLDPEKENDIADAICLARAYLDKFVK